MAVQQIEFDTNPIDWSTANLSTVHTANYIYYYINHPKYEGKVFVIGDGTTTLGNLHVHADSNQMVKSASISTGNYVLATTETTSGESSSAIFIVKADSESYIINTSVTDSIVSKTPENTGFEVVSQGGSGKTLSFLLAKNDSTGGSGFKLIAVSTSSLTIEYQLIGGDDYWTLIDATTSGNTVTPGGQAASFMVAENPLHYEPSVTAGDWNIAKIDAVSGSSGSARFKIVDDGGITEIEASFVNSASAKTFTNTTIKYLSRSGSPEVSSVFIRKSDSVADAGCWLAVTLDTSSDVKVLKTDNTGNNAGWELVAFNQSVTLPDGSTGYTTLIAGSSWSISNTEYEPLPATCFRVGTTIVDITLNWGQMPYPDASSVSFTGNIDIIGGGTGTSVLGLTLRKVDHVNGTVKLRATVAASSVPTNTSVMAIAILTDVSITLS